jgi:hypothetical protein
MTNHTMPLPLPPAVERFVGAVNRSDGEEAVAAFATDALVNDIRREFHHTPAIRAWLEREIIGDAVHLDVRQVRAHHQTTIITARTTGNFDKTKVTDPLDLTLYFNASPEAITQLIVIANQPTPQWAAGDQVAS